MHAFIPGQRFRFFRCCPPSAEPDSGQQFTECAFGRECETRCRNPAKRHSCENVRQNARPLGSKIIGGLLMIPKGFVKVTRGKIRNGDWCVFKGDKENYGLCSAIIGIDVGKTCFNIYRRPLKSRKSKISKRPGRLTAQSNSFCLRST